MTGLDTTVLVAHELAEVENHRQVREGVAKAIKGDERFALTAQIIGEFIHVATDPRRFEKPLSMTDAAERARFWWTASEVTPCAPNDRAIPLMLDWMEEHRLGRKRILDTLLAATYHARGIRSLATANPGDFSVFGVFTFEDWARIGS